MPFKKMENIANFLKAIRAMGMKEFEMFSTPDLFEKKNVAQVATCIHAFARLVQTAFPASPHPKMGVKVAEKTERTFTEAQLREARAAVSVLNLGSSEHGKQACSDVLEGKRALEGVLGPGSSSRVLGSGAPAEGVRGGAGAAPSSGDGSA